MVSLGGGVQMAEEAAAAAQAAASIAEAALGQQQALVGRFTLAAQHLATDMAAAGEVRLPPPPPTAREHSNSSPYCLHSE